MIMKIELTDENAKLPDYAHEGDAGMDLYAVESVTLQPGERKLVGTGLKIQLPPNTEAQIRPKSGLALKNGITLLNTPGTVDEGYRGEVEVILINHSREAYSVEIGQKIAQMVIMPVTRVTVEKVDHLEDSVRGQGGFGSTGL
ncbi:dUTP diphosphatase [Isachenkonia alkalipeptolytica]|uniref:Deoxyuridine 5'-triphosphate nucleotidohydrolase n=1 Tax=Isachenkonia alkalipeptolytica TaxID=2565777 RepID=A0AA44BEQ8_9CLOT|nr:dUTP diphosphatase [Isachenkonia alkalipeptolytica]NBG87806.1 dUTP diphosphatase [Isachenkonia alkalipeptolytica]